VLDVTKPMQYAAIAKNNTVVIALNVATAPLPEAKPAEEKAAAPDAAPPLPRKRPCRKLRQHRQLRPQPLLPRQHPLHPSRRPAYCQETLTTAQPSTSQIGGTTYGGGASLLISRTRTSSTL